MLGNFPENPVFALREPRDVVANPKHIDFRLNTIVWRPGPRYLAKLVSLAGKVEGCLEAGPEPVRRYKGVFALLHHARVVLSTTRLRQQNEFSSETIFTFLTN